MKLGLAKLILNLDSFKIDSILHGVIYGVAEDRRVKIHYRYDTYTPRLIEYYNGSGQCDRNYNCGPARVYLSDHGDLIAEEYWHCGYLHRPASDGPASTIYSSDFKREEFWENGIQLYSEPLYSKI